MRYEKKLVNIEAISSLAVLLENSFFLQTSHLIVSTPKELENLKAFLRFKNPKLPWYDLPVFSKPHLFYSGVAGFKRRKWQAWAALNKPGIFLADPLGLLKKTSIKNNLCLIKQGENFSSSFLKSYIQKEFVERTGDFSKRGFLMDLFSPAYDTPLRLELTGSKIESIHLLDKEFKRRTQKIDYALVPSLYEWQFTGSDRKNICQYLHQQQSKLNYALPSELFKCFARGKLYSGFEYLLNCLDTTCSLDCFPKESLQIWLFEPEDTKNYFLKELSKLEVENSFWTKDHLFLDHKKLFFSFKEDLSFMENCLSFIHVNGKKKSKSAVDASDNLGFDFSNESTSDKLNSHVNGFDRHPSETKNLKENVKNITENLKYASTVNKSDATAVMTDLSPPFIATSGKYINDFHTKALSKKKPSFSATSNKKDFYSSITKKQNHLLQQFSSTFLKKIKDLKDNLKNLPVSHFVFASPRINELKQFLVEQNILSKKDLKKAVVGNKNFVFLSGSIKESFFCKGLGADDTAYFRAETLMLKEEQNTPNTSGYFDFFRLKAKALEFSKLAEGDLLVHRQHGVGEFRGLKLLQVTGAKKEEFIVLHYKGRDKLFVPVYRASQVKRYSRQKQGVAKSLLDTLGSPKNWERKKSKAKKHIQNLAIELMEIYRIRNQQTRPAFQFVKKDLKQFADGFPWSLTFDQQKAIEEIMHDMDGMRPMDRLLTADTGFGKTEVALRACFRVLQNGFQVCLLAPTTVLALQHFKNFKARFKGYPFCLELLSRFVSEKNKQSIFQKVRKGEIHFLIATHLAFNPKLVFKNLGLLVLDEEHRFGVRQKERLTRFRKTIDILSLSATPIPRTLNMALTGIKDISVISRPPEARKPVKILLKAMDQDLEGKFIVEACKKEKARGGQILFVHNRVKTLYSKAEYLRCLLPDFRIATARGQMEGLDKVILDFFEKKYDLLLTTNIIESGMDVPQANTLFIDRCHEMGLSQIYQLKGRVGRANKQAFCYLLFPNVKKLSVLARQRLELLQKYAGLGSAFQLALHDLEGRGAGSIFGSEQSGHLLQLGEELYFEILKSQLQKKKGVFIEPEIFLPFPTQIPESYMPEPRLRLLYYKSLSEASSEKSRLAVQSELIEDFGPLPDELKNLFFLLEIRDMCKQILIQDFRLTTDHIVLTFHEKTTVNTKTLLKLLKTKKGQMLSNLSCKLPLQSKDFMQEIKSLFKILTV